MIVEGGSLPPRKRLLIGLKQNGWSISPTPSSCLSRSSENAPDAVIQNSKNSSREDDVSADARVGSEVQSQDDQGCVRCEDLKNSAWQRLWKDGLTQRFCNACVLLYSENKHCPHCLGLYQDDKSQGDPSIWLICGKCQRSVHVECESKNNKCRASDPLFFLCPNCSVDKSPCNGIFGRRDNACRHSEGSPREDERTKEGSAVEIGSESFHFGGKLNKKRRICKESRATDNSGALSVHRGSIFTGQLSLSSSSKVTHDSVNHNSIMLSATTSVEETAAAAKAAACLAVKAAAVARATATAKASVAAKAAVAARAALEAAALAARAEAGAGAELSRRSVYLETKGHSSARTVQITGGSEPENTEDNNVEGPVDDEEYARHLHRVMNSSPRITRSATPSKKKIEVKNDTDALVKVPGQSGSCSSDEVPPFPKPQLTRPRSVIHKESRRMLTKICSIDNTKLQCAKIGCESQQSVSQVSAANDNVSLFTYQGHSSLSHCIEQSDSYLLMPSNQHTVDLLKTPTDETSRDADPPSESPENFGSAPSSEVCDERRKILHGCITPAVVGQCESEKIPIEGSKLKHSGIFEKLSDTHVMIEDEKQSCRVKLVHASVSAENTSPLQQQASEDQNFLRDHKSKSEGVLQQEVAKSMDKQNILCQQVLEQQNLLRDGRSKSKVASQQNVAEFVGNQKISHQHLKPISKLLSSVDKKRMAVNASSLSSNRAVEDEDNKPHKSTQNGEISGSRNRLQPFAANIDVGKHFGSKETTDKPEAEQLLYRKNVLKKDVEAVSSLFNSSHTVKSLNGNPKLRRFDALKSSRPSKGPNATFISSSSATVAALTSSSTVRHP